MGEDPGLISVTLVRTDGSGEDWGSISLTGVETDRRGGVRGRNTVTVGSHTDEIREERGRHTRNVYTQTTKRLSRRNDELFPGLLDDIVLSHVVPKLPSSVLKILSMVSRCWERAIKSRQVYDARVRSHSTETLFVVNGRVLVNRNLPGLGNVTGLCNVIRLYSLRENCSHELPPIPHLERGIPENSECISYEGKIYVLGGYKNLRRDHGSTYSSGPIRQASAEVYVLDVAGQRPWIQCARMQEPRTEFACGIVDGKIHVFGGKCDGKAVHGFEIYDPKVNAWSPIMPMRSWRYLHRVATAGEELFLYGGCWYVPDYFERKAERVACEYDDDLHPRDVELARCLEVYHPGQSKWRVVEPFWYRHAEGEVFTANGDIFLMKESSIDVFDTDKNSWTTRYRHSFDGVVPARPGMVYHFAVSAFGGELLIIMECFCFGDYYNRVQCILKSSGFGGEDTEIVWRQEATCSVPFIDSIVHPLQL